MDLLQLTDESGNPVSRPMTRWIAALDANASARAKSEGVLHQIAAACFGRA